MTSRIEAVGRVLPALVLMLLLSVAPASATDLLPRLAPFHAPDGRSDAIVTAIGVEKIAGGNRITVRVNMAIPFRTVILVDPARLVIDLPELSFAVPETFGQTEQGLVRRLRFGLFRAGRSRIVIDLRHPSIITNAVAVLNGDAHGHDGVEIAVEIAASDGAARVAGFPLREGAGPAQRAAPAIERADGRRVIVLDPGHGGLDEGARSAAGVKEKDLVLDFAQVLRSEIESRYGHRVMLTRDRDVYVPLPERVRLGQEVDASIFVSIHADSLPGKAVRGASVYTLSEEASDAEAAALAEHANMSDLIAGVERVQEPDEVAGILFDLMQRETNDASAAFASQLVTSLKGATRLLRKPHRRAGFRVLKAPDVPSVLLELGFISNDADEKLLASREWQSNMAEAVARAIDMWLQSNT